MQCLECREVMGRFIDGDVDGQTRREIGLHLAECEECLHLINGDRFWDDMVLSFLDREAPAGLRAEILGDLAAAYPAPRRPERSDLGWKKQLKIIGWAATRKISPKRWLETIAIVVGVLLVVELVIRIFE